MTDQPRPVWLDSKRHDRILKMLEDLGAAGADCTEALQLSFDWQAAPADPFDAADGAASKFAGRDYHTPLVLAILHSLGWRP